MNIYETIQREAGPHKNRIAVIDRDKSVTYGQLFDAVGKIARGLKETGVGPQDRVGILCPDSVDYITLSLATLSLSAVVVPVPPEQSAAETESLLDRIGVQHLIANQTHARPNSRPLPQEGFFTGSFTILSRTVAVPPPQEYFSVNPAFIRFTSGTTGASKGIVLSHESIVNRTDAADKGMQITAEDTVLWVLSMSFHFVVTILLFLRRAATIVLCQRPFPEALVDGVIKHKGTFIYASPFHYALLSRSEQLSSDALKNVRMAISTAMKLPENVAADFRAKFGFELTEAYGIIEVGLPFMNLTNDQSKRGSVGKHLPDYELAIRNPDASGAGEIWLRGKGMLDAYFSPWVKRADLLKDGWFKTGDIGRLDGDGFLFIVGRDKGVINFAGMKVFADEVEAALNSHPNVAESLVYGAPHPQYGQLPVAKVVLKDGELDAAELKRFCYERLSPYKVPKDIEFVNELLKTASGKIKRG